MEIRENGEALLLRLLQATGQRGRVIAQNTANTNTPGYSRQVVQFEELLGRALREGDRDALSEIQPQVVTDTVTPAKPDGNNVNAELERQAGQENNVLGQVWMTLLEAHYSSLHTAITGR